MRSAVPGGTTVLTTHYMDEAERLCDRVAIVDHGRMISLGTPRELIASLGAGHVIEFAVDASREIDDATLLALPGVKSARRAGATWALQVGAAHETIPALLAFACLTRHAAHGAAHALADARGCVRHADRKEPSR